MVTLIKIYKVLKDIDKTDGGGLRSLDYFRLESIAQVMAKGKGVMSTTGQIIHRNALECSDGQVFLLASDKLAHVNSTIREAFRESARRKLIPDEVTAVELDGD